MMTAEPTTQPTLALAPPTPRRSSLGLSLAALLAASLVATLLASGCGDDDSGSTCELNEDCASGQLCIGGRCIDTTGHACRSNAECAPGETCDNNVCVESDGGTPDAGTDAGTDPIVDPVVDQPRPDIPVEDTVDEEVASTPPVIESTTPAADETGVALDAVVSIVWDQPMEAATFTAANVNVEDWSGVALERQISYNAPTNTVTLSPVNAAAFFAPASPYTLTVAREVRGTNGLNPAARFEMTFYTRTYDDMATYEALAEAYAPVVYAEVREPDDARDLSPRMDMFTALDFDGDSDVTNNLAKALTRAQTIPAHVYWNVLETETHYLIQYVFYYPAGALDDNDRDEDAVEHDFAYSTVVVRKLADDPLGAFVMAEGLGDGQVYAFALNTYPSPCGGEGEADCVGASPDIDDVWVEFDPAELEPAVEGEGEPGRRYPLYITPVRHASCLAPAFDPEAFRVGNRCVHNLGDGAPFAGNNAETSQVLTLGETAENWGAAGDETPNVMTYTMSPFLDLWWTQRANDQIWDDSRTYAVPPEGAGSGNIKVPSSLATTEPVAASVSRRAPFQAEADSGRTCDGCSRVGVWFVDPAWEILGHADFDHDFSGNYCFNPFLGIDRRTDEACQ